MSKSNHMNKNKIIVGGVVVAVVFFGLGYAVNAKSAKPQENQMRFQVMGGGGSGATFAMTRGGRQGALAGGGFLTGSVLSMDEKSVTLKLQDGGSRIVFISPSTPVSKSVEGSLADLKVGERVMVTGSQNQDGSFTAQAFQIRPEGFGTTTRQRY